VTASIVNLGYVVNVIEDVVERKKVLAEAWGLTQRVLVVSARLSHERDQAHIAPHGDGWISSTRTFQRFFEQEELGGWIEQVLSEPAIPAALGTFLVFRTPRDRQLFEATQVRTFSFLQRKELSSRAYAEHADLFAEFEMFLGDHGRPPFAGEDPRCDELALRLGSLKRATNVVLMVRGQEWWQDVTLARRKDLYVHLALQAFSGRLRWGSLPDSLQRDVRALAGTYKAACEQADTLLKAVGNAKARELAMRVSPVGKITGNALYLHETALADAPVLLRMYEACARQLTGEVAGNVIKLWRGEPGISYLAYPEFDRTAHPALARSTVVDLLDRSVRVQVFEGRPNPPILHRKEQFLAENDPRRQPWSDLTQEEEAAGLFDDPSRIGTLAGWQLKLAERGILIRDHAIQRATGRGSGRTV
jgi:DNA phosphorothioation-associated putative methyltransferase